MHAVSDPRTPDVDGTVRNEMKPIQIVRECAAQFPARSLVHQHMYINIHCPELLEILKWNERFTTKDGGRVLGNKQKLGRFVRRNIQRLQLPQFLKSC